MTNTILCNAFSLQMVDVDKLNIVHFRPMSLDEVKDNVAVAQVDNTFINAVGHADTMNVLNNMLGTKLTANRISVKLDSNTTIIVAQVVGQRLPEGCTTLPEGTKIKFVEVSLMKWVDFTH